MSINFRGNAPKDIETADETIIPIQLISNNTCRMRSNIKNTHPQISNTSYISNTSDNPYIEKRN